MSYMLMGCLGIDQDFKGFVVLFFSDVSVYMIGQNIVVDGGIIVI